MQVNGTVIKTEIDTSIAKKDGGSYQGCLLIYKDNKDGKIKDRAFHNNTFKFNANLRTQLTSLKEGDWFVMEMEKNGEFWNVVSINKTDGKMNDSGTNQRSSNAISIATSFDHKQDLIIRQNCVGNAVKYLELLGSKDKTFVFTVEGVVGIAKKFEEYVNKGTLTEEEVDDVI